MKKTNDDANNKLYAMLENLELPDVQMPARQRRLRETLLASSCLEKEGAIPAASSFPKISALISKLKPQAWKLAASVVMVFLVVGVYLSFFTVPLAVASLTLQVNPALTLTISGKNTVINAEGLDAQAEALLTGLDVTGRELHEALRIIAGALREAGLLGPNQHIVASLHAIEEGLTAEERLTAPELFTMAENVRHALLGYMAEQDLPVEVKVAEATAELVDLAHTRGLLPADYVDLMSAAGYPLSKELLKLQQELGIDPDLFREELGTMKAALDDMREAGIESQDDLLAIFRKALAADLHLEELTTITAAVIDLREAGATQEDIMALFGLLEELLAAGLDRELLLEEFSTIAAAMIDLADEGLSKKDALLRIQAAIKADPTLHNFDDLLEPGGDKEAVEDVGDDKPETGRREPDNRGRDNPEPSDSPEPDRREPGNPERDQPEPDKPGSGKPEPGRPQVPGNVPGNETDEE